MKVSERQKERDKSDFVIWKRRKEKKATQEIPAVEVGPPVPENLSSEEEVTPYERAGYVMSGSRHLTMDVVQISTQENKTNKKRKAETKSKDLNESRVLSDLRRMLQK